MSNCNDCNTSTPYLYNVSPVDQVNMSTYYNAPAPVYFGGCSNNNSGGANSSGSWIDEYLRTNFKYGYKVVNDDTGATQLSLIPSWLINWDTIQTPENSRGYKMGATFTTPGSDGKWQQYIKIVGDKAYQYKRDEISGQEMIGGDWLFSIPNDYIRSVSGGKIIEPHKLFSKVAAPITNYIDPLTGQLSNGNVAVPVVYTVTNNGTGDITQLKAILTPSTLNSNIVSQLATPKGLLWNSNPLQNTVTGFNPQNLDNLTNVAIDGTTIRAVPTGQTIVGTGGNSGGAGDRPGGTFLKSYAYTDNITTEGDGTTANPIKVKERLPAKYSSIQIKRLSGVYNITPTGGNALDNYPINQKIWVSYGDMDINSSNFVLQVYAEFFLGDFQETAVTSPSYGKWHIEIANNPTFTDAIDIPFKVFGTDAWSIIPNGGNQWITRTFFYFPETNLPAGKYYFRSGLEWGTNVSRRLYIGNGNNMVVTVLPREQ